jgi:cell fate regulator YaaT (PSP1 superfamily)
MYIVHKYLGDLILRRPIHSKRNLVKMTRYALTSCLRNRKPDTNVRTSPNTIHTLTRHMEVSHQYEYDNDNEHVINYFSNNQMVLHLQAENAHISKQINKIIKLV